MKKYKSKITRYKLVKEPVDINKVKISSSEDAMIYMKDFFGSDIDIHESFFLLLMNRANITTGYVKISQGGTAGTVVDPILVSKYAIESLASSVILAHNHPSGNIKPSENDINLTKKIVQGLKMFDIHVLDHLIIPGNDVEYYFSFADEGLI